MTRSVGWVYQVEDSTLLEEMKVSTKETCFSNEGSRATDGQ